MRLLESGKVRGRATTQTVASTLLHAAVIGAAVYATAGADAGAPREIRDTAIVFLPPPQPRAATPPAVAPSIADAPVQGFQLVPPVLDIPTSIPPVDLTTPFSKDDWSGRGEPGGRHDGDAVVDTSAGLPPVFVADDVDEPVVAVLIPGPRYPPVLREARIEGEVVVRYVVDSTGRVEPASWVVVRASHDGFREPAREAIVAGLFTPARVRGRLVRQLVQQTIRFTLQ